MLKTRRNEPIFSLLTLFTLMLIQAQLAYGDDCRVGDRPAATLLVPYFEIDLKDPSGRTTLISIGNTSEQPALAHVVIWTDCGLPVLNFSVYLGADALQSLNLRSIVVDGRLPVTGAGVEPFPGCSSPIDLPVLDAAALATLLARLAGEPDPADGLCYGSPHDGPRQAIGYLTVDSVSGCSDSVRTPRDEGYFVAGGSGLANNDNVLWGDVFLIDPETEAAQGFSAVSLVADAEHFAGPAPQSSFYGLGDQRLPLNSRFRSRFFAGGGFDGGTDLIVWFQPSPFFFAGPVECAEACYGSGLVDVTERDEKGAFITNRGVVTRGSTLRIAVDSEQLPVSRSFGLLDLEVLEHCPICSPPYFSTQGWVWPIYSGSGRYSVGLPAVRLDDRFCEP